MRLNATKVRGLMEANGLSQAELARRSGVSRQRLIAILGEKEPEVRIVTAGKLADALGQKMDSICIEGTRQKYLEWVAEEHKHLEVGGLAIVGTGNRVSLEQVFAQITLSEPEDLSQRRDCKPKERVKRRDDFVPRADESIRLADAVTDKRRFFLLGGPGSGKTTALKHIALAYASGRQSRHSYPDEQIVPIYVRLSGWARRLSDDGGVDLVGAALAQLSRYDDTETADWLRGQIKERNAILLLDGWDEVPDPDLQERLAEKIRAVLDASDDLRVILTSRKIGFERPNLGAEFDTMEIRPLSDDAIRTLTFELTSLRHGHASRRHCQSCRNLLTQVLKEIDGTAAVRALAGNPMMLTILLLLYESGATLPRRRWDLFEKITEALLFSWEERKRMALGGTPDKGLRLDNREIRWILESIALEVHRRGGTLVSRSWLAAHITSFLRDDLNVDESEAPVISDTLIWSLQARSGIIIESAPETFSFAHLGFQEYFAACAILSQPEPVEAIQSYAYNPRWAETVSLVAGQLDRHRAPRLARVILDDPDPTGRLLHRGLILVLRCLAEGAHFHQPDLLDQIGEEVTSLGRNKWLGIAMEAVHLLEELSGTRLGEFAKDAVEGMLKVAQADLTAQECFTLIRVAADCGFRNLADFEEREPLSEDARLGPVTEQKYSFGGEQFYFTSFKTSSPPPPTWVGELTRQLRIATSMRVRSTCALVLGRLVVLGEKLREDLLAALEIEKDDVVRAFLVSALRRAAADPAVKGRLVHYLDNDPSVEFRGACAEALELGAAADAAVLKRLVDILLSGSADVVREGCAYGLKKVATQSQDVQGVLLSVARDRNGSDQVKASCLRALPETMLAGDIGKRLLSDLVAEPADGLPARAAAQLVAALAAKGRAGWSELPIERAEHVLASQKQPCGHDYRALHTLLAAREQHKLGISREARIRRALAGLGPRVHVAFIFGSSARGEQRAHSDIDLMVIGNVSLEEVTPGLRSVELDLDRPVNAIVYSVEEWRKRCRDGAPFIREVLAGEKVFVVGGDYELTAMA